jgi:hypothetical protein
LVSRTENEAGWRDGFRVGWDGTDPDGNPAGGYDETYFGRPDYQAGLSEGRTQRIDEELVRNPGQIPGWPGVKA